MNQIELLASQALTHSNEQKRDAMAVANFVKAGKLKKYLETATAMTGEDIGEHYVFVSRSTIYVSFTVRNLDGFKSERLMGILNAFEYLNPTNQDVQEFAGQLNKEFIYRYLHRGAEGTPTVNVRVTVNCYAKDDSPTCKRVVVGYTDGKPQPIYKIECLDDAEPIDHLADDVATQDDIGG